MRGQLSATRSAQSKQSDRAWDRSLNHAHAWLPSRGSGAGSSGGTGTVLATDSVKGPSGDGGEEPADGQDQALRPAGSIAKQRWLWRYRLPAGPYRPCDKFVTTLQNPLMAQCAFARGDGDITRPFPWLLLSKQDRSGSGPITCTLLSGHGLAAAR